jgi:rhamnosyltransferase
MLKVAGVVILYYPDSEVVERINSYLNQIDHLFVFDNSEKQKNSWLSERLKQFNNTTYFADGENRGISVRLNQAAQMAIDEQFDWLLTMDQDSYFSNNNFANFLTCLKNYPEKKHVAVFGVQYLDPTSQSSTCVASTINHLITSGSIMNLHLFPSIGAFDEALFIDQVDSEYCYRSILKGHRIVQFNNVYLQHSLGKQSTHISLKSLKKTSRSLHSPLRLYYMTRNYFYMRTKYQKDFSVEITELKEDLLNRIKNNFLYSSERFSVIKNVLSGIIDYKRKKMGKKF